MSDTRINQIVVIVETKPKPATTNQLRIQYTEPVTKLNTDKTSTQNTEYQQTDFYYQEQAIQYYSINVYILSMSLFIGIMGNYIQCVNRYY